MPWPFLYRDEAEPIGTTKGWQPMTRDSKETRDAIGRRAKGGAHAMTAHEAYEQRGNRWVRHEHKRRRRG